MGRVPTTPEVLAGLVSEKPRGLEAGRYTLNYLFPDGESILDTEGRPIFKSAAVYGSTVDGYETGSKAYVRSDLDVIIIHDSDSYNPAYRTKEHLRFTIDKLFGVTLEAQLHPPGGKPDEDDPGYALHIYDICSRYPEWRVGNPANELKDRLKLLPTASDLLFEELKNPLELLPSKSDLMLKACDYLISKMLLFDKAERDYIGFADHMVIQRAFESASAIGRKILPATIEIGELLPPVSDKPGMRALVQKKTEKYFGKKSTDVIGDMKWIAAKDSEYTDVLVDTLIARRRLLSRGLPRATEVGELRAIGKRHTDWIEENYMESVIRSGRLCRAWGNKLEDELVILDPDKVQDLDASESYSWYEDNDNYY